MTNHAMKSSIVQALLLVGATLVATSRPVEGQTGTPPAPPAAPASRGWIGISFTYHASSDSAASAPVVIQQVFEGSPADRAGLRPGDVILRVDGHATDAGRFRSFGARIRSGQPVTLSVRRGGRTRDVSLKTGERPTFAAAPLPPEIVIYLDSLRSAVLRRFDSLQLQMRAPDADMAPARIEPAPSIRRPMSGAEVTDDSLRLRLRSLQEELLRTGKEEQDLVASVTARPGSSGRVSAEDRRRIGALRARADSLETELQAVYQGIALRTARAAAGTMRRARMQARAYAGAPDEPTAPSPHLLGRNYVAGAQVTTVNPGLSSYFGVDRGVLVTEILQDSPAEDAGLQPGDVVVSVAGREVPTVEALRGALMQLERWPADLEVVRKGDRIRVQLPR